MHFVGAGKGFIDATRGGNIARFINHRGSTNLCSVKDVMYDHSEESLPHKMLFAVKDIVVVRELSFDYNCYKGNVKVRNNNFFLEDHRIGENKILKSSFKPLCMKSNFKQRQRSSEFHLPFSIYISFFFLRLSDLGEKGMRPTTYFPWEGS